ncbi:double-strand break repair helicase AddA [Polycladidibacter stylochi]|uniref:double-strand break repair helicase AddA n=1 Tax=Polycladidibacter stylochi TaxID=1807766 RepID=UPI00082E91B6|nr:double-strand break repair helicase AddA [Pseudovibrio stylochi]
MEIPSKTLDSQQKAAHPENSAWVSANAGSGKTFVLSRRVVRLLLAGTNPAKILCLTFTKAAASEMATRVFDVLSSWTSMDDAALAKELEQIEGQSPSEKQIKRARRLFAKALETPGGLKIQTIHAFCESILHQFPLEANVAGHFSVLDDRTTAELLQQARDFVLRKAESEPETQLGQALARLISLLPDSGVDKALGELIGKRDKIRQWVGDEGSLDAALDALQRDFGIAKQESLSSLEDELRSNCLFDANTALSYAEALRCGTKTDCERADKIARAFQATDNQGWRAVWLPIFLTGKLEARKSLATKKVKTSYPDVVEALENEQQRLLSLLERQRALITLQGTEAILRLSEAVLDFYENEKSRRGFLDFEDLVVRCASLLARSEAAQWVQYKLDRGLDHILVDEAQDTSPRQWQVIGVLAEEFFVGSGASETVRTIFAVGDEKQSIYSFQGAVPAYFAYMRQYFAQKAQNSGNAFEGLELNLSFRSTPEVLGAVDKVFASPDTYKGLSQDNIAPVHEAIRRHDAGLVEIWPLVEAPQIEEPEDWTQPIDRIGTSNPMIKVAMRIAEQIKDWSKRGVASPGDVLVLTRKRGPFVEALNRELKRQSIPVAGADRLVLSDHIAVKDLTALARFILLPEDDLSLACVLKSPLFGLDDNDLFEIAHEEPGRPRPGTLWHMLLKKSETGELPAMSKWQQVRARLEQWRDRADFVPPFEFYARILGADGFRLKFRERMGTEVDDVLDEFLSLTISCEQNGIQGLEGFINWLEQAPTQIKRELNAVTGQVRIMTVHGSKGLEAPFVILVDSCAKPVSSQHNPVVLEKERAQKSVAAPSLVWLPAKENQTGWHKDALEKLHDAEREEYRRLLYVALTRAKDRLVVCGWQPKSGAAADCWYQLVYNGLLAELREQKNARGDIVAWHWTVGGSEKPEPSLGVQENKKVETPMILPKWCMEPLKAPVKPRRLRPSGAIEEVDIKTEKTSPQAIDALAIARKPENWPLVRGQLTHRLLEILPDMPSEEWEEAIERYLASELPQEFIKYKLDIKRAVLNTLETPIAHNLFSQKARAEVAIQGILTGQDGKPLEVFGVVDRLLVLENELFILDYKTNFYVPSTLDEISDDYVAQLAIYKELLKQIYPGWTIRALLLYTAGPSLFEIPNERLDRFSF